jgi:predicted nuclease of predicted toxin-antitoxin system
LNKIKFIADVHISPLTIERLEKNGYDIQRITEFLSPRAGDEEIINLSIEKNAVIITQDLDFSNLIVQLWIDKTECYFYPYRKTHPEKSSKNFT